MNNQEYEQKKRECWEEFRTHVVCGTDNPKGWFERAFDRAYALGQQFGNSEQVDVEKAAEKFADEIRIPASIPGALVPFINGLAHDAYLQGAQDFLGKQETKQESKQETVISGWVARDESGDLYMYTCKPKKISNLGYWDGHVADVALSNNPFPDLTWESEPEEVQIIIKRKKQNL